METDCKPLRGGAAAKPAPINPSRAARRRPPPPQLADLALIDAPQIAAAACIGLSTWYDLVRSGAAPQPALRGPRCTRWKLAEIRQWLQRRAAGG